MNRKLALALAPVLLMVSVVATASPASAQEDDDPILIGLINGSGLFGAILNNDSPSLIGFIGFDAGLGGAIIPEGAFNGTGTSAPSTAAAPDLGTGSFGLGDLPDVGTGGGGGGGGDLDLSQLLGSGAGSLPTNDFVNFDALLSGPSLVSESTGVPANPISADDSSTGAATLIPVAFGLLALYVAMMRVVRRKSAAVTA